MKSKHILIFEHDIIKYPPILSLITFLFYEQKSITLIGYCSDERFIADFQSKGGVFKQVIKNNVSDSSIVKIWKYFSFKRRVKAVLKKVDANDTRVWFFGEKCTWLLHDFISRFKSNIYLFEIPSFSVSNRYRLLSPSLNYKRALKSAEHVICCEYNRAHITKSFFELEKLPTVIPNKPNFENADTQLDSELEMYARKLQNKKVILYQGIFNYPERRLDGFCEAISLLPQDFVLCLMGSENDYKRKLRKQFNSDRIVFIDYVAAPQHLEITKLAYIGILVYNGEGENISSTLNTLYCAPNKVYEYSRFGVPMISNDVPALNFLFNHYESGVTVQNDSGDIAKCILEISRHYKRYSQGSRKMYLSVDLDKLYLEIL